MTPIIVFLFYVAMWVIGSAPLFVIAEKMAHNSPWMAFVPLLSTYLLVTLSDSDGAGCLLLIIPVVNLVAFAWFWSKVAEEAGQPTALGWLCGIPLLGFPFQIVLAVRIPAPLRGAM